MGEKSRPCCTWNHQSIKRLEKEIIWKVKNISDFRNGIQESLNFSCLLSFNLCLLTMQIYITRTMDMSKKGIQSVLNVTYANNQG